MTDTTHIETRTGLRLAVRAVRENDGQALASFFAAVSDDDRRFRFLSVAPAVNRGQLQDMTHCDHHHSETFLATDPGDGRIVAAATLAADEPRALAEVAISVRADQRGQGIGWSMLLHVAEQARRWGVGRLQAIESRANHAAISLEREQGFTARPVEGDASLVILEKSFG
jgi:GNAT superfamily N-acetyltransferase